jgi:DNA mismatch endonuclease (patch repair protein)
MKAVKVSGGPLEKKVRSELRRLGLRFVTNYKGLPGSPDIVLRVHKVAVFIDGDFWHGWRLPSWEHKMAPYWKEKLRANRARDRRNFRRLRRRNWTVIRLWEHQIESDFNQSIARIRAATS